MLPSQQGKVTPEQLSAAHPVSLSAWACVNVSPTEGGVSPALRNMAAWKSVAVVAVVAPPSPGIPSGPSASVPRMSYWNSLKTTPDPPASRTSPPSSDNRIELITAVLVWSLALPSVLPGPWMIG